MPWLNPSRRMLTCETSFALHKSVQDYLHVSWCSEPKIPPVQVSTGVQGAHSRLNPAKVQLTKYSSASLCRNPLNPKASSLQLWFHPTEKAQTAFHTSHSPLIIKIPKLTAILESCFNPDASESTEKRIPISQVEVDGRVTAHTLWEDKINHHTQRYNPYVPSV